MKKLTLEDLKKMTKQEVLQKHLYYMQCLLTGELGEHQSTCFKNLQLTDEYCKKMGY